MVASFLGTTGHVTTVPLEHRRTVYSEWSTKICFPKVFGEIRKTKKRKQSIVYRDNASSHTSAPNDFFLFSHIEKIMRGRRFLTLEDDLKRSKPMF